MNRLLRVFFVLLLLSLAGCREREASSREARSAGGTASSAETAARGSDEVSAAPAETAARVSAGLHLKFDFERGRVSVTGFKAGESAAPTEPLSAPLAGGEAADLEEFRVLLAQQGLGAAALDARKEDRLNYLAHDLGQRLLSPLAAVLAQAPRWTVSPLEAAPLEALVLPWGDGETHVLQRVVVSYESSAPPVPGQNVPQGQNMPRGQSAPREKNAPAAARGLLVLIPYTPDLTPVQDDPDTLLWCLRPRIRRVFTVPRIETSPQELEEALRAADPVYSLILLRARPTEAEPLLPILARTPSFLWWVRPPREPQSRGYAGEAATRARCLAETARLERSHRGLAVDLWPRDDETMKRAAAEWVAALQTGDSAARALTEARRALAAEDPAHPGRWAGWIAVGEVDGPVRIERPGFLRRLFSSDH